MSSPGTYWTKSWNCILGCEKCSKGCDRCWAEVMIRRMAATGALTVDEAACIMEGGKWNGFRILIERWLDKPLRWKKPRTIAVNWLGDMWRRKVPDEWIERVFNRAFEAPQHQYLFLTKQAEEMARRLNAYPAHTWSDNWWFGLTVCNQKELDDKIADLLRIQGNLWLSLEPLLSAVDLDQALPYRSDRLCGDAIHPCIKGYTKCPRPCEEYLEDAKGSEGPKVSWVVVGAETGPGARPCDPAWVRSIVNQCQSAGVPVWVKQAPDDGFGWPREKPEGMP